MAGNRFAKTDRKKQSHIELTYFPSKPNSTAKLTIHDKNGKACAHWDFNGADELEAYADMVRNAAKIMREGESVNTEFT